MPAQNVFSIDVERLRSVCNLLPDEDDFPQLVERLGNVLPGLRFERVLSRGGWHRIGGVVDGDYGRVAEHIDEWAARESDGDVTRLLDKYGGAGFFATRLQGRTHYLTAPCGHAPADFVQLEVEQLQEVLDRYLIDPDWLPDDLEEFVDPMDYPRLEPEPVGATRFVFRRLLRIPDWRAEREAAYGQDVAQSRWFADWQGSSAASEPMCRHWVMGLRETVDSNGTSHLVGRPVAADPVSELPDLANGLQGVELANALHNFDRAAGYGFAWYFHMLATTRVPFEIGETVFGDLASGFTYLPQRDAHVLRAWADARYRP
ncbi:MAG: hypothetical protein KDJ24_13445 [Gammaproteobacteria bacterium]|nr:hypothetical protein [Gammaproteobacteria bacterium]